MVTEAGYVGAMSTGARARLREIRHIVSLIRTRASSAGARDLDTAGWSLLLHFAGWALPGYVPSKPGKTWFQDAEFFRAYDRLKPADRRRSAERKYFLRSLLSLADGLPGDTAECGVYKGAASWFICQHFVGSGKVHHGFDSFEGLSSPASIDGSFWRKGDCTTGEHAAYTTLSGFPVELHGGWIPDRFHEVANHRFCFVHVDVDLYAPTRDSIEFFYPRVVPGGVMLFDDYGSSASPGAARAISEFMSDRPEPLVEVPTQQAFVIKR